MRIGDEGTVWRVRALIERAQSCQKDLTIMQQQIKGIQVSMEGVKKEIELAQAHVENAILIEKKRLNIPDNWVYNPETGEFKEFSALSEEERKAMVGGPA